MAFGTIFSGFALSTIAVIAVCSGCRENVAAPQGNTSTAKTAPFVLEGAEIVVRPSTNAVFKPAKPGAGEGEGTWVLLGDDWVYYCGPGATVNTDTVVASADGSTLIVENTGTSTDGTVIAILVETSGKPGSVVHTYDDGGPLKKLRDFTYDPDNTDPKKRIKHSYIIVDKKMHTVSAPKKLDITDDTLQNEPANDKEAYKLLQKVDKALANYGGEKKLKRDK